MKTLLRVSVIGVFLALLGLSLAGFVATFWPMAELKRWVWRTAYALIAMASLCGALRPARCQWLCWTKQRDGGGHSSSIPFT